MSSLNQVTPTPIPQSDWQTDLFLSGLFEISPDTFRKNWIPDLVNYGLESTKYGNRVLVKTASLYIAMEKKNAKEEKKPKKG